MHERSNDNLVWIDLEFTNLDPSVGFIMQAAMIVTRGDLTPIPPPGIEAEVGGLLYDVALTPEQAATASEWVQENQREQLARSQSEGAISLEKVEELFVGYLLTCCEVPDDIRSRPLLAGNSVAGDRNYLDQHMPRLTELMSFRLLDVTSLKELTRRWCPEKEFTKTPVTIKQWYPAPIEVKGEAHDALFDIKGSIAELAFYRQNLFCEAAHQKEG